MLPYSSHLTLICTVLAFCQRFMWHSMQFQYYVNPLKYIYISLLYDVNVLTKSKVAWPLLGILVHLTLNSPSLIPARGYGQTIITVSVTSYSLGRRFRRSSLTGDMFICHQQDSARDTSDLCGHRTVRIWTQSTKIFRASCSTSILVRSSIIIPTFPVNWQVRPHLRTCCHVV